MFFGHMNSIEISKIKISGKSPNVSKVNYKILNNPWIEEYIRGEIEEYFK